MDPEICPKCGKLMYNLNNICPHCNCDIIIFRNPELESLEFEITYQERPDISHLKFLPNLLSFFEFNIYLASF